MIEQGYGIGDFYSHASCEARLSLILPGSTPLGFLLTRLLRGATNVFSNRPGIGRISTHTPLARRDPRISARLPISRISTHTPLARRDQRAFSQGRVQVHFYSHASCEARHCGSGGKITTLLFLLTRLLRGATKTQTQKNNLEQFLLTRLLRGAT